MLRIKKVFMPKRVPPTSIDDKEAVLKKLWKRTIKDEETGCWLWQGALNCVTHGHGRIHLCKFGEKYYVHRLSAYIHLDYDLNSAYIVCHKCPNPHCWNPEHLYIGSHMTNAKDRVDTEGGYSDKFHTWYVRNQIKFHEDD